MSDLTDRVKRAYSDQIFNGAALTLTPGDAALLGAYAFMKSVVADHATPKDERFYPQQVREPGSTPVDVADAPRRLERLQRATRALVEARHGMLGICGQVGESQANGPFDQSVDRQRPCLPVEPRHAQMAEDDHILGRRQPLLHLMRQERYATEESCGRELGKVQRPCSCCGREHAG